MKSRMIRVLLTYCVVFSSTCYLHAQPGVDWQLVGNNALPTDFFGTLNTQSLNFRTFNTQRMTILGNNGFVGIDAVAPVFNLTIGTQSPGASGPFSDGGILAFGVNGSGAVLPNGLTDDRFDQNTPNPFKEQTTITFFIPDEVEKAQIVFYETSGRVMKMVEILERGHGTLTVFAEKLSSGIYSYSLIADGKLIDTKKMVCSK